LDVTLESVLCTEELVRRPFRASDFQAENKALLALAKELANSPASILNSLVDATLLLCRAHSTGISILEDPAGNPSAQGDHFR
jgi:hypothetical protein